MAVLLGESLTGSCLVGPARTSIQDFWIPSSEGMTDNIVQQYEFTPGNGFGPR